MYNRYEGFFVKATDTPGPFPYQIAFANASPLPELLNAPTGAGKTATAILGWLWRRRFATEQVKTKTPRRLVYCLPMRVLVEQTYKEAEKWLTNLGLQEEIKVRLLMGGEDAEDWDLYPEQDAILIGTQDMLLSRALNRGYGMSRFRWPMHFALLNTDCLWIFDEMQLMGSGVSTSAQLEGLRYSLATFGNCLSLWMSATMDRSWLGTVDFCDRLTSLKELRLSTEELTKGPLGKRMTARKIIKPAVVAADARDKKGYGKAVAEAVKLAHQENSLTLVIMNTVDSAKAVYEALNKSKGLVANLLLLHSRFRPTERAKLVETLKENSSSDTGRIIVATQVVEAGVDISARVLFTELAPWSSLVQRFGRCHRYGELTEGGQIFWLDLPDEKLAPPYEPEALNFAREHLAHLTDRDVSPAELAKYQNAQGIRLPFEHRHVIRRRDVIDLFDTSPDLSGNDIDVSRFVRGDDPETDVQIFWRNFEPKIGPGDEPAPRREELCPAPVRQARDFLKRIAERKITGYIWDHLEGGWRPLRDSQVRPGITILLPAVAGGYTWDGIRGLGWNSDETNPVSPLEIPSKLAEPEEGVGSDPLSGGTPQPSPPLSIAQHTQNVCNELDGLLQAFTELPAEWQTHLTVAARRHDLGKAHDAFQQGILCANPALDRNELWAKSGTNKRLRHGRKYFRHELASALACLQFGLPFEAVYLIGAHHGKIRLAIRSLPDEDQPDDPKKLFALGVHQGDPLKETALGGGEISQEVPHLDLSPMQLGGEVSWTGRALALRDALGPFRLALFETLLRVADVRASQKEAQNA